MKYILASCLLVASFSSFAQKAVVSVTLTPAGSFQATSTKVKGKLADNGGMITSDKITVNVESFKTGIELRDEHFAKHLKASKKPAAEKVTLYNLKAKDGKAKADLEVNGVKKPIDITYKIEGDMVKAKFAVKASQFELPKAEYLGVGVSDDVQVEVEMPKK